MALELGRWWWGSRGGLDVGQFCLTQYQVLRCSRGPHCPQSKFFLDSAVAWAVNRRCKEPRQWFIDTSDEDYKRLCFGLIQPNQ